MKKEFPKSVELEKTEPKNSNKLGLLDKFASSCGLVVNEQKGSSKNKTINDELNLYAIARQGASYSDFGEFWKKNQIKLPFLANAVRKYCCISATSVPSESRFSIANFVSRKERAHLSSKNLRFSMMLREKKNLMSFKRGNISY